MKKTWRSTGLATDTMNDLTVVQMCSTNLTQFDPQPAINVWLNGAKRRRKVTQKESPSRSVVVDADCSSDQWRIQGGGGVGPPLFGSDINVFCSFLSGYTSPSEAACFFSV